MMRDTLHTPVLLNEVLSYLDPSPGKTILDCTIGAGGHAFAIAEKGADVIGLDRDLDMLEHTRVTVADKGLADRITIIHTSFARMADVIDKKVDGILFDLGVSSLQLDDASRGFSFNKDADLDMRMDRSLTVSAKELIGGLSKKELALLFEKYGEISSPTRLADRIVDERKKHPITSTRALAEIVEHSLPREGKIHPATRVFQALRIAVNDELGELKAALPSALSLLSPGGVLVVISFHSLEDRIVKTFFNEHEGSMLETLTDKPVTPSDLEINENPRARSAKLRACRKLDAIKEVI